MNSNFRNLLINLITNNHVFLKQKIDDFKLQQRNFMLKQDINRDIYYSLCSDYDLKMNYEIELIQTKLNTNKNIKSVFSINKLCTLEQICLLKLLQEILLKKYQKSEKSLYKFLDKIEKNTLKNEFQKNKSKIKKKLNLIIERKHYDYKSKCIDKNKIITIIDQIEKLSFTTKKCDTNRKELIFICKKVLENNEKIFTDLSNYVNFVPDYLFSQIKQNIIYSY